jgi:hypothetical protein
MEATMNKNLRIFGTAAAALVLLLSSCSSSSESEPRIADIQTRLETATGFSWKVISLSEVSPFDVKRYSSPGYIQNLRPFDLDLSECFVGVSVWENNEVAKNAKAQFSNLNVWQFEDPLTKYGIILVDFGQPCSDAVASAFDFVIPRKN